MTSQRIASLAAILALIGSFWCTNAVLATMQPDKWLWGADYATVNNVTSIFRSEVILTAYDYTDNNSPMPILTNPIRDPLPCNGNQKLMNFYEFHPPVNAWPFFGMATAEKVWVQGQQGCQIVYCDKGFPDPTPANACNKTTVRPNFGDVILNATELRSFSWPQFTITHEPGHLLGRQHEIGGAWMGVSDDDCDPSTIMFNGPCRERWIKNHNDLFGDLQSSDASWIQANF